MKGRLSCCRVGARQARESYGRPVFAPTPAGPVLLESKLRPPPVRAGLIPRVRLDALWEAGTRARLCLIDAPAGSGKTTLLARWCLADEASRRVAWVSLDESDDDPVRFWVYIIEAFRVVAPGFGEAPLGLLQGSGAADVALGLAAGIATAALFSATLDGPALHDWGWRLAFLLALPLGLVGLWIRLRAGETPGFLAVQRRDATARTPLADPAHRTP